MSFPSHLQTGLAVFETGLTLAETGFNVTNTYLPTKIGDQDLTKVRNTGIDWRRYLGFGLIAVGTLSTLGATIAHFVSKDASGLCKNIAFQGVKYVGHGLGNWGRSVLEQVGHFQIPLAIYDVIGQKFLSYNNAIASFDIQSRVFTLIKDKATLIPTLIPSVTAKVSAFL